MTRLSLLALPALLLLAIAPLAACDGSVGGEGEGEGGGGEGEGGEGEGEGGEGEGEGGEGEGEGGEGEGEGGGPDTVGDRNSPTAITLPFDDPAVDITAGDEDCYSFTVIDAGILRATANSPGCEARTTDPQIDLYDAADLTSTIASSDDVNGFCPDLLASLTPGTYVICVVGGTSNAAFTGAAFHVEIGPINVLATGATCDPNDIANVCNAANSEQCLFDGTSSLCAAPITLTDGTVCSLADQVHVCDAVNGSACLSGSAPDDLHCAVQNQLGAGDVCIANTTANVCNAAAGLVCTNDGAGNFTCVNPDTAACTATTEIADATQPVTVTTNAVSTIGSSCEGSARTDAIAHFVADASAAFIAIHVSTLDSFDVISARTTCDAIATEAGCDIFASSLDFAVAGGSDVFLLVGSFNPTTAVTFTITQTPVVELGPGATCAPASVSAGCSVAQSLACAASLTCSDATIVAADLAAADPTWNRDGVTCGSGTTAVHFDRYTVTNSGGVATTLEALTRNPNSIVAGTCEPDTFLHAFSAFDPAAPTTGCLSGDDDGGEGTHCSALTTPLAAGASVDIVVSGFDAGEIGAYRLELIAPGTTITVSP